MIREFGHICASGALVEPHVMARQARSVLAGADFDTMVGTGQSGSLVVPILARVLDCRWLIMRKPGDRHHHDGPRAADDVAIGTIGDRWLLVDDGIKTGKTMRRVREQIPQIAPGSVFAGCYTYGDHGRPSPGYPVREGNYYDARGCDDLLARIDDDNEVDRLLRSLLAERYAS